MQRRTKYCCNYGYVSGSGIFDSIVDIYNSLPNIPDPIKDSLEDSLLNIGKKGISAIGSRAGDKLADLIINKPKESKPKKDKTIENAQIKEPIKSTNTKSEEDIRREVLEDLKIIPKNSKKLVYGEGIRYL